MTVTTSNSLVQQAATALGISPSIVAAQINEESGGDATALSPAGAEGEFQFLPSTYTGLGFPAGTEDDPTEEVKAYITYMGNLLKWAGGDIQQALAGYNAGQGNWQAGLGYANTILANAGAGQGAKASGGTGATTGGGGGATTAQPAQTVSAGTSGNPWVDAMEWAGNFTSIVPDLGGVVKVLADGANAVGSVNHTVALLIDYPLSMFKPGQAWRLVFTAITVVLGFFAYRSFVAPGEGPDGTHDKMPLAILLIGLGVLSGFMAFRPWPAPQDQPIKPGAYMYEILSGQVPAAGPPAVSPAEVHVTEFALDTFAAIWALQKISGTLDNTATAIEQAKQAALGWWGDLF